MKISTKGRYALRMLLDLAEHQNTGLRAPQGDCRAAADITKNLEQIIPLFNRSDMLLTNRGAQGGYMLARQPAQYTVGEVLRLTEGTLVPVACVQSPAQCDRSADCATLPVWQGLSRVISEYLDGITLQDILDQHRERAIDDYVI